MALKQAATAIGTLLMIVSAGALLFTIRDFTQAMRTGGASAAYNSSQVVFNGVLALVTLLVALGLLRDQLRRRLPRLIFVAATIVVVAAGTYIGSVR